MLVEERQHRGQRQPPQVGGDHDLDPGQPVDPLRSVVGSAPRFGSGLQSWPTLDEVGVVDGRDPAAAELVSTVKDPETLERSHGKLQQLIDRR